MIDPQAKAAHDVMAAAAPFDQLGVDATRALVAQFAAPSGPGDDRISIDDRLALGVPVRVYRPVGRTAVPVIVFIHGGGWIFGDVDGADAICRELVSAGAVAVVSVGYRLSPEAQFPLPLQDCVNVVRWALEHGRGEGFDPARVCVAGESSGGQLAAATCLQARSLNLPVAFQLLVNPVVDPSLSSRSWSELGGSWLPPRSQMSWMWDMYTGTQQIRDTEPLVNLTLDQDLSGLPPALILTAEFDPLRDEAEDYGRRLAAAGVATDVRRLPGQIHAVFSLIGSVDACRDALHDAVKTVAGHLSGNRDEASR